MNQFGQAAANWDDNRSRKALAGTPHQPFAAQALPAASALNYREAKLTNLWPFLAVALALPVLASAQAAENPKREHALANKSEDELVAKIAEFGIKVWDELEKGVALEAKKDLHKLGATPSPQVSPSPSPSAPSCLLNSIGAKPHRGAQTDRERS